MKIILALTKFGTATKVAFLPVHKIVNLSLRRGKLLINLNFGLEERTLQHQQYIMLLEKYWIH